LTATLAFDVRVVDGEGIPVPAVEVGARYRYPTASRTWSSELTDGDGLAQFCDDHAERPEEVCLFVGEDDCGTYPLSEGCHLVLEM